MKELQFVRLLIGIAPTMLLPSTNLLDRGVKHNVKIKRSFTAWTVFCA